MFRSSLIGGTKRVKVQTHYVVLQYIETCNSGLIPCCSVKILLKDFEGSKSFSRRDKCPPFPLLKRNPDIVASGHPLASKVWTMARKFWTMARKMRTMARKVWTMA